MLVAKLSRGQPYSISALTQGSRLSRQAVTKHLRVLQRAGIVRGSRQGRESLFRLDPQPIDKLRVYLGFVSEQWDQALDRLRTFVER
jgi:DNA-binding transcriptional ArsR family regulator